MRMFSDPKATPAATAQTDNCPQQVQEQGPVLVLGAGGARGLAHIGVLKVLEDLGIRVSAIIGSSMGAEIGVAYAFGISADHLESIALGVRKRHALSIIFSHSKRSRFLFDLYGPHLLEDTMIPVSVIATDLDTGMPVILDSGSAVNAVHSSISIPGVFPACRHQGKRLIDGAISLPLPVSVARAQYPGRKIIAVSPCHAHLDGVVAGNGRTATLKRTMQITHRQLILEHVQNYPPDVLITPTIPDIDTFDLHKAREAVHAGQVAAMGCLEGFWGVFHPERYSIRTGSHDSRA